VENRGSKFGQLTYDSTICGATKPGETHGLLEEPTIALYFVFRNGDVRTTYSLQMAASI
jgi:hypothetical protein